MKRSEELHIEHVRAKKMFNRILREKTGLAELLLNMETLGHDHLPEKARTETIPGSDDETLDSTALSETGKHLLSLVEHSFDYSEDEQYNQEVNPVSLAEWLKRNQSKVEGPRRTKRKNSETFDEDHKRAKFD